MPVAYEQGEKRPKPPKKKKTTPKVHQAPPAPTYAAVQQASRRDIARTATARQTPIRRVAPTARQIRRTDAAKKIRREQAAQRRRQPFGRGISATAADIAGYIASQGPGRPAPNARAVQATAKQLARAAQPMLSERQFGRLYGGAGSYEAYAKFVAKAREVPVGTLLNVDQPDISRAAYREVYRAPRARLMRKIGELPARLTQGGVHGNIPVLIDWEGEFSELAPSTQKRISAVIRSAISYQGTDYQLSSPAGRGLYTGRPTAFDCSGLINFVYTTEAGINIGTYTGTQRYAGRRVGANEGYQPGDLLFWHENRGHVGMYLGDGYFIEAPAEMAGAGVVQITRLTDRSTPPIEARRIIEASGRRA